MGIIAFVVFLVGGVLAWSNQAHTAPTATRFVDGGANPITGRVRVLCYVSPSADPFADLILNVTNGLPADPLPADCAFIAALREVVIVDSNKPDHGPAYTLYHASFTPNDTTPLPTGGDITLSSANRLTLFHVVASLGWEPAADTTSLSSAALRESLRGTSAYLYNLTEGQMAFGPVDIWQDGYRWQAADIRVLPANDRRPSAFVGGISPAVRSYSGGVEPTIYTPAEIYLGRSWDGALGAADPERGRWTNIITGSRTIGHEWAHYALFLYDEYQQTSGGSQYCICATLPAGCGAGQLDGSVMAYQYSAGEFWHLFTHLGSYERSICESTWNWHFHGNTDWKLLNTWGGIQGNSIDAFNFPTTLATQVPTLADDFFGRKPGQTTHLPMIARPGSAATEPTEPLLTIDVDTSISAGRWPFSEVYVFKGEYDNPERILPMGRARGGTPAATVGQMRLLGIEPADRARVYVQLFDSGALYGYPTVAGDEQTPLSDGQVVTATAHSWEYALDHRFSVESGIITGVTFHLKAADLGEAPRIQLCGVDSDIGCSGSWTAEMDSVGSDEWQAEFDASTVGLDEMPRFLVVRVNAPDQELVGDIVQWLQVSGGVGPGHVDGIAPLVDGEVMLNTSDPVFGDKNDPNCHITSYGPARNSDMLSDPLPPNRVLVSLPMLTRIEIPDDLCPAITLGDDATFSYDIVINLGYEQVDVDRLGVSEGSLRLMRYFPGSGWVEMQTVSVNPDLNILIGSIGRDGIYAVGAVVP